MIIIDLLKLFVWVIYLRIKDLLPRKTRLNIVQPHQYNEVDLDILIKIGAIDKLSSFPYLLPLYSEDSLSSCFYSFFTASERDFLLEPSKIKLKYGRPLK